MLRQHMYCAVSDVDNDIVGRCHNIISCLYKNTVYQ